MTAKTGQTLWFLLPLCTSTPSVQIPRRRFLGSLPMVSEYLSSMAFHAGESDGWRKTPGLLVLVACHVKFSAVAFDWKRRLNRGIMGKYHSTLAGVFL